MNAIADFQPELAIRLDRVGEATFANDVREFEQLLRGRGWVKARAICALRPQWYDREFRYVRRLASASKAILSGPGTPGYCLIAELTEQQLEEIDHAGNSMISQGRGMARRGIHFRRIAALRRKALALATPQTPTA